MDFSCFSFEDNYARFFLKYVAPVKSMIDDGRYAFQSLEMLENWDSVMGLQFENMVVNNYGELLPFLHLSGTLLTSAAPYRKQAVPSKTERAAKSTCCCSPAGRSTWWK